MAGKVCYHCGSSNSKERFFSLSSISKDLPIPINDTMKYVLCNAKVYGGIKNIFEETYTPRLDKRFLCSGCVSAYKSCYLSLKNLANKLPGIESAQQSAISEQFHTSCSTSTNAEVQCDIDIPKKSDEDERRKSLLRRIAKTPIRKKMIKAQLSNRTATAMRNTIRAMIQEEMKIVTKRSVFARSDVSKLPSEDEINNEMSHIAPTSFAAIKGLFYSTRIKNHVCPPITAGIGMAVYSRDHRKNIFQKAVGLQLWKTQASQKVMKVSKTCTLTREVFMIADFLGASKVWFYMLVSNHP